MPGKGLFSGVGEAKVNFGSNYEREGHYFMFVRRIKRDTNRRGIEFVAVEKVCLKVLNPMDEPQPHRVGEMLSHLLMSDKDPFLSNIKSMIANLMGANPNEVDEESCDMVVGESQPLSCRIIEVQNRVVKTNPKPGQKEGGLFTVIGYKRTLTPDEVLAGIPMETLQEYLSKEELETVLDGASAAE